MTPFELVSKRVMPYMRALVAIELVEGGISQNEAARALGVTQPMVKKYVKAGRARPMAELEGAGLAPEAVQAAVGALSEAARRGYWDYVSSMSSMAASALSRGTLCALHRRVDRGVPESCSICAEMFYSASDPYIEDALEAFAALQSSPDSYGLVPEVGMNVSVAPPDARRPEDVAGFPGRIVRVGTKVVALGRPTYGGSVHTAGVLLMARRAWEPIRAAISMRYDEGILNGMREAGLRIVAMEASSGDAMWNALSGSGGPPDALVDPGGQGIEPIVYVFGETAVAAARKVLSALATGGKRRANAGFASEGQRRARHNVA